MTSIKLMREAGINVAAVRERCPGQSDEYILRVAHDDKRGLLTFDRDFGALIFRRRLFCPPAVVFIKFTPRTPEEPAEAILALLNTDQPIEGYFVVLDHDSFRRRRLPRER